MLILGKLFDQEVEFLHRVVEPLRLDQEPGDPEALAFHRAVDFGENRQDDLLGNLARGDLALPELVDPSDRAEIRP